MFTPRTTTCRRSCHCSKATDMVTRSGRSTARGALERDFRTSGFTPTGSERAAPMIRVGLTERHGMAVEQSQVAPEGVTFSFLTPTRLSPPPLLRSPIKGYMQDYDFASADLVEAIISPIITSRPWIYSCENLHAAIAFS